MPAAEDAGGVAGVPRVADASLAPGPLGREGWQAPPLEGARCFPVSSPKSCSVVFVTPPITKPSEPNLSGPAAARSLRERGVQALAIDASIGWYTYALRADALEPLVGRVAETNAVAALAFRRHLRSLGRQPSPLRRPETYRSREVYTSAITHLDGALQLASSPFGGVRLRLADVEIDGLRPESRAALAELAHRAGPFDAYFTEVLIPRIEAARASHLALSLTFQSQVAAAMRLAVLLGERLPRVTRLLGGPLVACWAATGVALEGLAFDLFDRVVPGNEEDLASLCVECGGRAEPLVPPGPLTLDLDEPSWDDYLAPMPIVPVALGRGCYWRRCAFCPDHLHPRHGLCAPEALDAWLDQVAARFPGGAMLHLTDSALPPRHLARLARDIARRRLPLRWHGFVRPERIFGDEGFVRLLAEGGCAMLQIGVESGSPRLLEAMGKGASVEGMRRMLRTAHGAGIRTQVYLLFGLPTESEADRERTLDLIEEEAEAMSDVNLAILNLPRGSPMHRHPRDFGISAIVPFHAHTDLSLYDDFRCGASHPRVEARRWLDHRFLKSRAVRDILGDLRAPFKANHACFLPHR